MATQNFGARDWLAARLSKSSIWIPPGARPVPADSPVIPPSVLSSAVTGRPS
jgi:hypothetical protein